MRWPTSYQWFHHLKIPDPQATPQPVYFIHFGIRIFKISPGELDKLPKRGLL